MNLKKLNILLILFIGLLNINSIFYASETTSVVDDRFVPADSLSQSVEKAVDGTNFNGSVMISKNNGDSYDIIYQGAVGKDGGYNIDTLYDLGSISKVYTTTAIMMLEEDGKLSYDDKITKYFDNVPADKSNVTIKMLLTHTSGIYADENENHHVSKEDEINRILSSNQQFEPDSNYLYSNAGFTLLAAIIEEASGMTYEQYLTTEIFEPLGLERTGFPNSNYLKDDPAVSGTLDGVSYGKVTNFDFGWYSKGYTDVLTTPRELTYFFQALISGRLIGTDNLQLMGLEEVELENANYRGYGTEIQKAGTDNKVVGHSGVWYGGNSAVYYRPADQVLFVLACDQLNVANDLPANHAFNTLNGMYAAGTLADNAVIESVAIEPLITANQQLPTFDVDVSEIDNEQLIDPLSKTATTKTIKSQIKSIIRLIKNHSNIVLIVICIILIIFLGSILIYRLRRK